MGVSRVDGVLRQGVLSSKAQRLVRALCEDGRTQEMVEAVARGLLRQGIQRIPANAGEKTRDLLDRAEAAMYLEVEEYHAKGGVLTAKGYVSIQGLVAEMAKIWLKDFSQIPDIQTVSLEDPGVQDRLTLLALKLRETLLDKGVTTQETPGVVLVLTLEDLEELCQKAALEFFKAFQNPNKANHLLIHKEKT